jgi:flagellar biosynthesis protein FlhF
MEVQTFRAHSMQEALQLVRRTLGPDAAVLQAKEVGRGAMSWLTGAREIEVLALSGVHLPSRFAASEAAEPDAWADPAAEEEPSIDSTEDPSFADSAERWDYRSKFRADLRCEYALQPSLVEQLAAASCLPDERDRPLPLGMLRQLLHRAEISSDCACDLLARVGCSITDPQRADVSQLLLHAQRVLEQEIRVSGPIHIGATRPYVVALVGSTGVGKTTTIAKLAAEFRLRKHRRVGLITMDTYRVAAVEQLRAYAEIIEVPLEVVSTHREMRLAVDRLSSLDLILIDTAGRSPRDEVRIRELKSLLGEAQTDEVHLVLSAAAGMSSLMHAAHRFQSVGVTAMLLTKLDEAARLGGLLSLFRDSRLPVSYLADGQSVSDDIRPADPGGLARMILGLDTLHSEA